MRRLIAHVDADCFYVSCERVRHPALTGKPAGVLGNQGACVIAKSYEMKAAGVKTGMPVWDAVTICPDGIFIKRDFHWYEVLSRLILKLIKDVSPEVEYYSVDEMFFNAGFLSRIYKAPPEAAARMLQQHILTETGVPVSIGISFTKTLAKLASDAEKPFGCKALLNSDEISAYLKRQPVKELCGIGSKSEWKLKNHGIHTCYQFATANRVFIRKLLTRSGEAILHELNGHIINPIVTKRPIHRYLARGGSLGSTGKTRTEVYGWLVRNVERLIEALDAHAYICQSIALYLIFKRGGSWGRRLTLPCETAASDYIFPAVALLFSQSACKEAVSHMHIIAGNIRYRGNEQLSLFDSQPITPSDALKRLVNARFGRFSLRAADTLSLPEIYADRAQAYDICDIYGKSCF